MSAEALDRLSLTNAKPGFIETSLREWASARSYQTSDGANPCHAALDQRLQSLPTLSPVYSGRSRGELADLPVTNGPYGVTAWTPGKRLVLERNRSYRDALTGAADEVHYIVLGRATGRVDAYQRGELDTLPVADQDLAWAQENVPDELQSSDLPSGAYLLVTAGDTPLGRDLNLRRALALALDRTALTKSVSPPGLRPTDAAYPLAAA